MFIWIISLMINWYNIYYSNKWLTLDYFLFSQFPPRLKPGCEPQLPDIEAELKCQLEKVNWLSGFFAIPQYIQIASTNAYRSGKVCCGTDLIQTNCL